jgi:hypothetical protein
MKRILRRVLWVPSFSSGVDPCTCTDDMLELELMKHYTCLSPNGKPTTTSLYAYTLCVCVKIPRHQQVYTLTTHRRAGRTKEDAARRGYQVLVSRLPSRFNLVPGVSGVRNSLVFG